MKLPRRKFLHLAAGAAALPSVSRIARAQDRPSRPVRIIVGFTAGSATDITARLFAQKLNEAWKTPVTVENIPGAGGPLGCTSCVWSSRPVRRARLDRQRGIELHLRAAGFIQLCLGDAFRAAQVGQG
jgi:hypothetical protein